MGRALREEPFGDTVVASVERLQPSAPPNMIWIPRGTLRMGSGNSPAHRVTVDGFWVVELPVCADAPKACSMPENPRCGREEDRYHVCQPAIIIPRKVIKGGSHLCAPNDCRRHRPAARHAEPVDTSTSHLGFSCVLAGGMTDGGLP